MYTVLKKLQHLLHEHNKEVSLLVWSSSEGTCSQIMVTLQRSRLQPAQLVLGIVGGPSPCHLPKKQQFVLLFLPHHFPLHLFDMQLSDVACALMLSEIALFYIYLTCLGVDHHRSQIYSVSSITCQKILPKNYLQVCGMVNRVQLVWLPFRLLLPECLENIPRCLVSSLEGLPVQHCQLEPWLFLQATPQVVASWPALHWTDITIELLHVDVKDLPFTVWKKAWGKSVAVLTALTLS